MEHSELIISLLALAFGLWAGIVGYFAHGIRQDLRAISRDLRQESRRLNTYIIQTESRLAVIEARHEEKNK